MPLAASTSQRHCFHARRNIPCGSCRAAIFAKRSVLKIFQSWAWKFLRDRQEEWPGILGRFMA